MEELNKYIFNVFNLMREVQRSGELKRPLKLKINRKDKKIIKNIYSVYRLYKYHISINDFYLISGNYSIDSGLNIIKAASEQAELLEKINIK